MALRFVTLAGHGGEDSGAPNPYNPNLPEKTLNLLIDAEFARLAVLNGHAVYRLRTNDIKVSANLLYPKVLEFGAHCAFEFHCDSFPNASANGCHAIVYPDSPGAVVGNSLAGYIEQLTGIRSLGIRDHFYGTSPTPIYTINIQRFQELRYHVHAMTESGFISNLSDQTVLASSWGRTRIAYAHLWAVHDHFNLGKPILVEKPLIPNEILVGFSVLLIAAGMYGFAIKLGKQDSDKPVGRVL